MTKPPSLGAVTQALMQHMYGWCSCKQILYGTVKDFSFHKFTIQKWIISKI